jgi:ABC-type spermidine/putrescine transport system permease subunit I
LRKQGEPLGFFVNEKNSQKKLYIKKILNIEMFENGGFIYRSECELSVSILLLTTLVLIAFAYPLGLYMIYHSSSLYFYITAVLMGICMIPFMIILLIQECLKLKDFIETYNILNNNPKGIDYTIVSLHPKKDTLNLKNE